MFAASNTEGCNNYVPTEVDVKVQYDEVDYDYTTPMLKIRDLSEGGKGKDSLHSEAWPVGLSTGEMYFRVNSDIMKMRAGYSQTTCGQIKSIQVEFGFKDNKIYVAKEFPKRSCPFKVVLAHEEKHKAVDRALLEDHSEKIRIAMRDIAKKIGVVQSASAVVVEDQINSVLNQEVNKLMRGVEDDLKERQKEVDTKEEYQRVTDSCEGRTMEIVQQRLELLEESHPGITKVRQGSR
ncbi:MAG: hypothetical protein SFW65_03035 [Alphaproteobacteria bacterium]|nr:hypothetical protein [Alphaproteobacteria bacterium]